NPDRAACAREKRASSTRPAYVRFEPRPCGVRSREESVFDPASVRSLPTPTVRRALARRERLRPGQRALAPNPDRAACARERRAFSNSAIRALAPNPDRAACAREKRASSNSAIRALAPNPDRAAWGREERGSSDSAILAVGIYLTLW